MTVSPVRRRASCTRMEPTPPEAPTTSKSAGVLRLSQGNAQAVEEQLPCGEGGERQRGGLGEGERAAACGRRGAHRRDGTRLLVPGRAMAPA